MHKSSEHDRQPCRNQLRRGAIASIARLTGVNIHTVRLWVNHGEPPHSRLDRKKADELRKCILAHVVLGGKSA